MQANTEQRLRPTNRRGGLVAGAKLAFAAPAVVAALSATGVASASGGSGRGKGRGRGRDHDSDRHDRRVIHTVQTVQPNCACPTGAAKVKHVRLDHDTGTNATFSHTGTDDTVRAHTANLDCALDAKLATVVNTNAKLDRGGCKLFTTDGVARRVFVRMKKAHANTMHRLLFVAHDGSPFVLANFRTNGNGDCRLVADVQQVFFVPVVAANQVAGRCIIQAEVNGQFVTHFVASRIFV